MGRPAPWTSVLCACMECIGHRSRFVRPIRTDLFACDGQNGSGVRSNPHSAAEYRGPGRRSTVKGNGSRGATMRKQYKTVDNSSKVLYTVHHKGGKR